MKTLGESILEAVRRQPGITDRWLAEALFGAGTPQQRVNGECRRLAASGILKRRPRPDGLIGNFVDVLPTATFVDAPTIPAVQATLLSEDQLKTALKSWLEGLGWSVEVAWAKTRGIDIHARRGDERWVIEAKGGGSLDPMRVNYFLAVLGETLQRMDDPKAAYSIAFPDLKQFRNLWDRLPRLAKDRTGISALFVDSHNLVVHIQD